MCSSVAKHRRSMLPEGEGGSKKRRVAAGEGPKMALAEGAL